MKLKKLITQIQTLDGSLKGEANKAVNRMLTIRNWLIGYYIVEYEQEGEDRAKYGDKLLKTIASRLRSKGLSETTLKISRQFFLIYPQISQTVSDLLHQYQKQNLQISQTPSDLFKTNKRSREAMGLMVSVQLKNTKSSSLQKSQTPSDQFGDMRLAEKIISNLSFSHISLLLTLNDDLKRTFYAVEAMKGTWSVKQLRRQITSLLFERCSMSKKPKLLLNKSKNISKQDQATFIKDIYTFEFLGLPVKDAVEESDLETALLDHLQEFLLEMGHGFCFEARQKKILMEDRYNTIDLVFYHRILKCHVLIDLKVEEFDHQNAGQLNAYLNYYKKKIKRKEDNSPVGILMVTDKNDMMVEYATAGMDQRLFVRKYMLQLPKKNQLLAFMKKELRNI